MSDVILIPAGTVLESFSWSPKTITLKNPIRAEVWLAKPREAVPIDNHYYGLPAVYQTLPPLKIPRSTRADLTRGSVWEFAQDWVYIPFGTTNVRGETIPAGTRFRVTSPKIDFDSWRPFPYSPRPHAFIRIRCMVPDCFRLPWSNRLPIAEIAPLIRLVEPGQPRGRWRLVTDDGSLIVDKKFDSLTAVKASARIRFGVTASRFDPGHDQVDITRGVWAQEVDQDGVEIRRENLSLFLVMKKLEAN